MKKALIIIMAIIMIASAALISVGAEATTNTEVGPLIITEILNNPDGGDYYEYMEVMNIGNSAIDLYDYKFWYRSGSNLASVPNPDPAASKWNVFASAPSENVLDPGEVAIIWFVVPSIHIPEEGGNVPADVEWFRKDIAEAEKADYTHTLTDYTGKSYAYNVDAFKQLVTAKIESLGRTVDEALSTAKIIICDISLDLETPSNEKIEAGQVGTAIHFNMATCGATKAVKYYITDRDIEVFDENTTVYAAAGVEAGGSWSGQTFQYKLPDVGYDQFYEIYSNNYTPGYLSDSFQPELINLRNAIDPNKYPDTAIIVTTTEKPENEVTTDEVTNPPRDTTTATNKPSTTTKPQDNNTAAPNDTSSDEKGGCGGFTVAAQLFAVLSAAFVFVVIKKKA